MGDEKPVLAALRWQFVARAEGDKCPRCGAVLTVDELKQYFETALSDYCNCKENNPERS